MFHSSPLMKHARRSPPASDYVTENSVDNLEKRKHFYLGAVNEMK